MKTFITAILFFVIATFAQAGEKIIAKDFAAGKRVGLEVGADYAYSPSPLEMANILAWRWKNEGHGDEQSWKAGFMKGWYQKKNLKSDI